MLTAVAKTTPQSDVCFVLFLFIYYSAEERERKNIKGGEGQISSGKVKVNV